MDFSVIGKALLTLATEGPGLAVHTAAIFGEVKDDLTLDDASAIDAALAKAKADDAAQTVKTDAALTAAEKD